MATSSAVEFYPIFDQTSIFSAKWQHNSIKLLQTQLTSVHLIKTAIEQVDVIV
jgi:hypothetical protein